MMNDYKSIQDLIVKAALYDGVSTTISADKLIGDDVIKFTFSKNNVHSIASVDLHYMGKEDHEDMTLYCCKRALNKLLFAPYEKIEVIKEREQ